MPSLLHTLDSFIRHGGAGRMLISLLPTTLQTKMRRTAWYERAKSGETLVDRDQIGPLFDRAWKELAASGEPLGDYLEFGVFNGTSMIEMHEALKRTHLEAPRLFGFDSFEGLPPESATAENEGWRPGTFASDIETTRARIKTTGIQDARFALVKGWLKDTLNEATRERLAIKTASVINIDVDIYTASKEALDFCAPLIGKLAFLNLDDWNFSEGQQKALKLFLDEHPEFTVEPFGEYTLNGNPAGKMFRVNRAT